jgi:hypothetical protein
MSLKSTDTALKSFITWVMEMTVPHTANTILVFTESNNSPTPKPPLERHPWPVFCDCLFNTFTVTLYVYFIPAWGLQEETFNYVYNHFTIRTFFCLQSNQLVLFTNKHSNIVNMGLHCTLDNHQTVHEIIIRPYLKLLQSRQHKGNNAALQSSAWSFLSWDLHSVYFSCLTYMCLMACPSRSTFPIEIIKKWKYRHYTTFKNKKSSTYISYHSQIKTMKYLLSSPGNQRIYRVNSTYCKLQHLPYMRHLFAVYSIPFCCLPF